MLPNEHITDRVVNRLKVRGLPSITSEVVDKAVYGNQLAVVAEGFTPDDYDRIRSEIEEYGFEVLPTS